MWKYNYQPLWFDEYSISKQSVFPLRPPVFNSVNIGSSCEAVLFDTLKPSEQIFFYILEARKDICVWWN